MRSLTYKKENLSKTSIILTILASVFMLLLLVLLGTMKNAKVTQSRTDGGYYKVEDYTCREMEDTKAPIGIRKEYTFILDPAMEMKMETDAHLAFYTVHQYVDVFLEGENVYSIQPSDNNRICKTVGSNWVMIPLYREDAGKEVRIEITPVYESFRNRQVDFLIGSQLDIYRDRLAKDLPQLILGIMTAFVGMIFICVAAYSLLRNRRGKGLAALGWFSVMMGLWRLTDTRFTPFIMPDKPVFLFYVSVAMLMLGIIPLIKWSKEYFHPAAYRLLDGYCILSALLCLVQLFLQFAGIADLREMLLYTHLLIGVGIVIIIGRIFYEHMKYPKKPKQIFGNFLPFICVAGVAADIAAFYLKGNSSGLLFSMLAFLLYIVFVGIATMFHYSKQELLFAEQERQLAEKDRELAEQERKLTEQRITSMMSQIKSHFIFNVLTTISSYCKVDAKKADRALIRFSRYLRKNIHIIETEGLVDFTEELEQVGDYVALEQMRFEDQIIFVTNIETTSFQIPPLTIQPIVENAIKHGLVGHGRSGTVCLNVMREKAHIVINVIDDGVGFHPKQQDSGESVGLKNVRYRLENMVNGTLAIESGPGEGTTVTIKIPLQESEC